MARADFKLVTEEHVPLAIAAFLLVHSEEVCGEEEVATERFGNLIHCHCERCEEERSFMVVAEL